jgi:hypothetical protein
MVRRTKLIKALLEGYQIEAVMPHINGYSVTRMIALIAGLHIHILAPKTFHQYLREDGCKTTIESPQMALRHLPTSEYVLLLHHKIEVPNRIDTPGHILFKKIKT